MKYLIYLVYGIRSFFYDVYYYLFENLEARVLAKDYATYKSMRYYPDYMKLGNAVENVHFLARKYCKGRGVDIGSKEWCLKGEDLEAKAIENNVENAYNILEENKSLDFIFSSHLLEHLEKPIEAIRHWDIKLKPDGIIFMYLPHPGSMMWDKKYSKFHIWNPNPLELEKLFIEMNYSIEYITYLPDGYYSFVVVVKKSRKA